MKTRAFLLAIFLASASHAQESAGARGAAVIETDPIRCWLKTTKTAVHVGEQFDLALTCAVIETARVTVVPEVGQIEPATIQLTPFEVLKGTRHPDIRSRLWRYFQYEYTLRLINDGFFGQDVAIPPVTLRYTVHTSGDGAEQQGIERSYVLPTVPVRIISLVPENAKDIRDASRGTFADIDRRQFRGTVGVTAALVLFAFAALCALLGLVRVFTHYRKRAQLAEPVVSEGRALDAAIHTLRRAADEAASSRWTTECIAAALGALRVGGAIASGRSFAQTRVTPAAPIREGQIAIGGTLLHPRRFLVSAATTPMAIDEAATDEHLRALREALVALSEARYARAAEIDGAGIDRSVDAALSALRAVRRRTTWPMRWWASLRQAVTTRRGLVWSR
jgi:hypothetical protein